MAITPTKTWEYIVNNTEPGAATAGRNQRLTYRLKRMLTADGTFQAVNASGANISIAVPWVVVASSDSVTADASDNWNADADLVWGNPGAAHSWIHLRLVDFFGPGDHLNYLLDLIGTFNNFGIRQSFVRGALGYNADGTTTNRPTVEAGKTEILTRDGTTSSTSVATDSGPWGPTTGTADVVIHYRIADDGSAGAWWVCIGGNQVSHAGWQKDEDGPSRVHPFTVWGISHNSTAEVMDRGSLAQAQVWDSLDDLDAAFSTFISETVVNNTTANRIILHNFGFDGTRWHERIKLVSTAKNAVMGLWTDVWWGSTNESTGDGSPSTPPAIYRQMGEFVIPWPSGVAYVST